MTTHTPGPWTAEIDNHQAPGLDWYAAAIGVGSPYEGTYRTLARVAIAEHTYDDLEAARAEADARLIAAAPDLLAALEPLLAEFGARLSDGKPLGYTVGAMHRALSMVRDAETAIRRAKGGAS